MDHAFIMEMKRKLSEQMPIRRFWFFQSYIAKFLNSDPQILSQSFGPKVLDPKFGSRIRLKADRTGYENVKDYPRKPIGWSDQMNLTSRSIQIPFGDWIYLLTLKGLARLKDYCATRRLWPILTFWAALKYLLLPSLYLIICLKYKIYTVCHDRDWLYWQYCLVQVHWDWL